MTQTLKVSSVNIRHVKRESLACRVACQSRKPLGSRMVMSACVDSVQARLASLRQLQSATGEELRLRTLLPSMLDRAFKGEL